MKRLFAVALGVVLLGSALYAGADSAVYQGQKTYLVKLKGSFKLDAGAFASQHTAREWVLLLQNGAGEFIDSYSSRYPRASRYLHSARFQKSVSDLQAFVVTYAKDSGQTPRCTCVL
jgi:hypothetical protein